MKSYEFTQFGLENLGIVERDTPKPKSNEVLVKIHAVSLNFRDLLFKNGLYNPKAKFPTVAIADGAGEIVEIGEAVTRWKVGDRVTNIYAPGWIEGELTAKKNKVTYGDGALQGVLTEYREFDENTLVRIPEHLSFEEASTLPIAAVTAWNALAVSGNLKAGETVLTLGTGGVSIFAIQFAKLFGAKVIATSSSDEKLARAKELGADEVINYKTREDWDVAAFELTNRVGVDHVVEVGGSGTLTRSINAVRSGGHIAVIGVLTSAPDFNIFPVLMKAIKLQGIFVGSRATFEEAYRAIEFAGLKPVIDKTFAFEDAREAFEYLESGSHFGKVVIKVGE
jgi:NADPH:quinone reductase-like Zn-dependent oxidoreductase